MRLAKYAVVLGASTHEARAAADDAVISLVLREQRFDLCPLADAERWLFAVVRNTVRKTLRARGREVPIDATQLADQLTQPTWSSPEQRVDAMEVLRSLCELDESYRIPVALASQGRSAQDIARILDISTDTAAQRISRGRKL
ncbi:sigma-70 family RNA polymerase sigma factor [Amycolatopsis sp. NPDC023774]|uniref:RNA polymerase sigma factor n=1 Tax=Amycolatopsis sp. NPDC023774 TaxID=3155015 RepID=UPI00340A1C59